ncbi:MAG: murein biosynthesis integral membrane protein MurJ [Candidatus Andersenbacteria bacterium]
MGTAGLIGLTALGGAAIGFVLQLLVAHYFGASPETDAYFMALSTSELLSKLLLGGSITAVFLPIFVHHLTKNERKEAWLVALNLFHVVVIVFGLLLLLLATFTDTFVTFIAPGFSDATQALTVSLIRLMLPAFLLYFLVDLATAILHALKRFTIPATLRVVAPGVSIICVAAAAQTIGIYALALGTVLGGAVQLSLLAWDLGKEGFRYRFILKPLDPAMKRLWYLSYPFVLAVLVTQGAGIVYRILVSELSTGSLSTLKYGEKITQLLTIIFLNSVTIVIYPLLSEKASRQDWRGMKDTIGNAIRLTTFTTVPIILGVAFLREPLISIIYQHGSFSQQAAQMTSQALLFLIIGLTTNAVSSILGHATLAMQKSRAAVAVTIASQAISIGLFIILVPRMQHAGLALASSLVPLSSALLYFLYLSRYLPRLASIFRHRTYAKIALLALLLASVLGYLRWGVVSNLPTTTFPTFLFLLLATILGSVVYFGGAYLWRVPEAHEVLQMVRRRFNKVSPLL